MGSDSREWVAGRGDLIGSVTNQAAGVATPLAPGPAPGGRAPLMLQLPAARGPNTAIQFAALTLIERALVRRSR